MEYHTPVGKTKDQGWEVGVRRTFPVSVEQAWEMLLSSPCIELWLGAGEDFVPEKGTTFRTDHGTRGYVVSVQEGSLLRMRWQPRNWAEPSTLQLRVIPAGERAVVSFHHEHLANADQREQMRKHWSGMLDCLEDLLQ